MSNREGKVRRGQQRPRGRPARAAPKLTRRTRLCPISRNEMARRPVVAVTGAARGLGHALAARLAAGGRVGRVIAIDDHRGDAAGVTWRVVDVRDPALAGRLAGVDVVVHTDLDLAPDSDHEGPAGVQRPRRADRADRRGGRRGRPGGAGHQRHGLRGPARQPGAAARGRAARRRPRRQRGRRPAGDRAAGRSASAQAHPGMAVTRGPARRAGRRGRGHPDHPALRGTPAAGGQGLRAPLAVLPPRRPGLGPGAGRGRRGHRRLRGRLRRLAGAGPAGGAVRAEAHRAAGRPDLRHRAAPATGPASPRPPSTTCTSSCTRGSWTARPCVRRAGGPATTTRPPWPSCSTQRAGHHAVAGRRLAKKDATITAAGATVAVIGTAAIVRRARRKRRDS